MPGKNDDLIVRQLLGLQALPERGLRTDVASSKLRFFKRVADAIASGAEPQGAVERFLPEHRTEILIALSDAYAAVIPRYGKFTLAHLRSPEFKDEDNYYDRLVVEYIGIEGLSNATSIADTSKNDVVGVIAEGVQSGSGTEQIGRDIRKVMRNLAIWRAATIARTETHNASMWAGFKTVENAERELGVIVGKRWIYTMDERTRNNHRKMGMHPVIPLKEKFKVPNEAGGFDLMDHPGDHRGSASNVVNCRCQTIYEPIEPEYL